MPRWVRKDRNKGVPSDHPKDGERKDQVLTSGQVSTDKKQKSKKGSVKSLPPKTRGEQRQYDKIKKQKKYTAKKTKSLLEGNLDIKKNNNGKVGKTASINLKPRKSTTPKRSVIHDIDTQTSVSISSVDCGLAKKNIYYVSFPLTSELKEEAIRRFPGITLVPRGKISQHDHPLSSIERRYVEEKLYEQAISHGCTELVDIGGNVARHYAAGRKLHSCNPVLEPQDEIRNMRYNRISEITNFKQSAYHRTVAEGLTWCRHAVEDCTCVIPDAYLSIHSLYYLDPDMIVELVYKSKQQKLFAAVHMFNKLMGTLFNYGGKAEASYECNMNGEALMKVTGNSSPYTHKNVMWLNKLYHVYDDKAIAWDMHYVGDTALVTFTSTSLTLASRVNMSLPFSEALKDDTYYGNVRKGDNGEKQVTSTYAQVNVYYTKVYSMGAYLWATPVDRKPVLLPKGVVEKVAMHMIGKPRTEDSFKECIARTKKEMAPTKIRMPEGMRVDSVVYISSLAFVYSIDEEIRVYNATLRKNKNKFSILDRIYKFLTIPFCCGVGDCFDKEVTIDPRRNYNQTNGSSTILASEKKSDGGMWNSTRVTMDLKPIRQGAKLIVNDCKPKGTYNTGFYQIAYGFADHIPVVPEVNQEHEIMAINNRALKLVNKEDLGMWGEVTTEYINWLYYNNEEHDLNHDDDYIEGIQNELPQIKPMEFEEWNRDFPLRRKMDHTKAKLVLENDGLNFNDCTRNAFIKRETYNKGSLNGTEDYDPRIIQGVSHKANVALGPWMANFNIYLKKIHSIDSRLCYASGLTTQQIGTWMEKSLKQIDDPVYVWCDFSRYDATQQKGAFLFEKTIYQKHGLHNYEDAWFVFKRQKDTLGYTRNNVKYRVKYTRKSGDPNTSCGNSMINMASNLYLVLKLLGCYHWRMIALGDDMLMVMNSSEILGIWSDIQTFINKYKEYMVALGFDPKPNYSYNIAHAEFCSSLFWPVGEGFCLGPKIGRLLPKMGFSLNNLKHDQIKGTFIGYRYLANHVPVLKDFIDAQLAFLESKNNEKKMSSKVKIIQNRYLYSSDIMHMDNETVLFFFERYGVYYSDVLKIIEPWLHKIANEDKNLLLPAGILDDYFECDNQ